MTNEEVPGKELKQSRTVAEKQLLYDREVEEATGGHLGSFKNHVIYQQPISSVHQSSLSFSAGSFTYCHLLYSLTFSTVQYFF